MQAEVSVAVNFVSSYLYSKLPRRRVDMFSEELLKGLLNKFEGHWYPEAPFKGSAFRCTKVTGINFDLDPVFEEAAKKSGLATQEVADQLPKELTVWVDPGEVSYQIGERGYVTPLLSRKRHEGPALSPVTQHDRQPIAVKPLDHDLTMLINSNSACSFDQQLAQFTSLSLAGGSSYPSLSNGGWSSASVSPYSSTSNFLAPPFATAQPQRSQSQTFTAAMFAQTKFGSTKLRTPQQAKRPSRLSPTEMTSPVPSQRQQQRQNLMAQQQQHPWMRMTSSTSPALSAQSSPCSLQTSPRDFRAIGDIFAVEQQQRRDNGYSPAHQLHHLHHQSPHHQPHPFLSPIKQQQQQQFLDAGFPRDSLSTSSSWSEMSWVANEFSSPIDSGNYLSEDPTNQGLRTARLFEDPANHVFGLTIAG